MNMILDKLRSLRECLRVTENRMRAVPAGTVGGLMATAEIPFSLKYSEMVTALRFSPTRTGTICDADGAAEIPEDSIMPLKLEAISSSFLPQQNGVQGGGGSNPLDPTIWVHSGHMVSRIWGNS